MKLLEENIGAYCHDLGVDKDFSNRTQEALTIVGEANRFYFSLEKEVRARPWVGTGEPCLTQ